MVDHALADQPAASWRAAIERVADQLLAAQGRPRHRRSTAHEGRPEPRRRGQASRRAIGLVVTAAGRPRRELEEVRERRSRRPDRGSPPDGRHARQDAAVRHDRPGHVRRCTRLPGRLHHRQAGPDPRRCRSCGCRAPGASPDLNERQLDARRRVHEAMQALGGHRQPGGSCVVARRRSAAERAGVGDAPGLGRTAGAAGAGAGDPGRGAGSAGVVGRPRIDRQAW